MGTLYVDRKGLHIKLDGNALAFYANGEREGLVPIMPLKRVVLVGNVVIETPVLNKLADEGITVVFLSGKSNRFHGTLHGRLHNNGFLRIRQYEKSLTPFAGEFSCEIVGRKIDAQSKLLEEALLMRPDLRLSLTCAAKTLKKIANSLDELKMKLTIPDQGISGGRADPMRGYEGSAAAAYFSAYTKLFPESLGFHNRNRRPPKDPVNAVLSLCYTLLHYEMVREIESIGLDPTVGFYHQFEYGRESLACDLVELYRPDMDRFVWNIFRDRSFTVRDFAVDDQKTSCYLKKEGRQRFYPLYEEHARSIRPAFVEEVRRLARKIMNGEDIYDGQDTVFE